MVDQRAHTRTNAELTGLFKSVSGKGDASAAKMATTFKVLAAMADWTAAATAVEAPDVQEATTDSGTDEREIREPYVAATAAGLSLHHDVHIHLPSTSDSTVYVAIFRALKAELLD